MTLHDRIEAPTPTRARAAGTRQLPRLSELAPLLQFRKPTLNRVTRRLESALSVADLRAIAARTTPRSVFDYVDGAADAEITHRRNLDAFTELRFLPEYLRSVANPDLSATIFGKKLAIPLAFAPTGYTRMMHHHGERAVAKVASHKGIPYSLSTVGTATAEEVQEAAPHGENWFQLYLTNDEALNNSLIDRALAAGFSAVMLTVDTAVAGSRLKDTRNGLTIPPTLTAKTLANMARYPSWWFNKLTTAPIGFASVRDYPGTSADVAALLFQPELNFEHLKWLRDRWPHKLLIKGVLSPGDAKKAVGLGADGVVVSNHGGRQLDRTPSTLEMLPKVRDAVGEDITVLLDGGVTHGQDIVAAIALGADAVMIGRAYLYGLMAGGAPGVDRAVEILEGEYRRGLQLLGLDSTEKIRPHHVGRPAQT